MRFEILSGTAPRSPAYTLDPSSPGAAGGWDILQTAAMATGAFPVFLAPRILERKLREYSPPMWESVISEATGTPPPIPPNFPADLKDPMRTLNVDGGLTNNDPFNYAHDYLNSLHPFSANARDSALNADRAVINIAPFPTTDKFDSGFVAEEQSGVLSALPRLFSSLVSQSRFFGESLDRIMNGTTFNRFVVAPSDPELLAKGASEKTPALQCAALGAFGGFFERKFRAHDYVLGRRNCQKFLSDYFVLPQDNIVMKQALDSMEPGARAAVINKFKRPPPGTYAKPEAILARMGESLPDVQKTASEIWLSIIPLCSEIVSRPIEPVERAQMSGAALKNVVSLILKRFGALVPIFLQQIPVAPLRVFLRAGQPFIRAMARRPLTDALIKELGDSYRP